MRLIVSASLIVLSLWSCTAHAEWMQASSAHFVIYADDSERDLRRFSEQLERYHSAMALLLQRNVEPPGPSNRVTVYVVSNERMVRDLYGANSKYIGGFYVPRAGGSLAIVPKVTTGTGWPTYSMIVLLHEYAHHFMISASSLPMPRWFSEGGAEFFAASSFETDGGVLLGRVAQHRAGELFAGQDVKVADLLDPTDYDKRPRSRDAFYGKSWLLYHFLTFDVTRQGQLEKYSTLLGQGKGLREAALGAFGDFETLEKDLHRYLLRPRIAMVKVPSARLQTGDIEVRKLSLGEAAMMPVRVRSRRGVDDEQAKPLLVEARAIAASFPRDPAVLSVLAEAEYDAGNDKEAVAAADAALALDPSQVNAYVQKGLALFRMAADAEDTATAYEQARAPFIALNHRENDHPLPLIYFYRSYTDQGKAPTPLAIAGLVRAVEVAPFDLGLRMNLATTLIRTNRQSDARRALVPVAYNPHGGSMADSARRLLARLDSEPGWKGADIEAVMADSTAETARQ